MAYKSCVASAIKQKGALSKNNMFYESCSNDKHHFNGVLSQVNHLQNPTIFKAWDKKCDCGKMTLPDKEIKKWLKQFKIKKNGGEL